MLLLPVHIAYGALSMFISLLNNVFILFYVTTFTNVFKIDSGSFYIGETIFLIWNSINDPLFGWMSDGSTLSGKKKVHNDVVLMRIRALAFHGPLFAFSFLLFWFSIFPVGLQFSLALCLYDSFLTMVDLNHQALLADLTVKANDRVTLNFFCSVFSAAGSLSVFVAFALWNDKNIGNFQIYCVILSIFVCVGFQICCKSMESHYKSFSKQIFVNSSKLKDQHSSIFAARTYIRQILRHKNFLVFTVMNLVQVFHCHFNSNFFPLFIQYLLGHALTPSGGAMLLGLSFLAPHINNLYFLQLCKKYGVYKVIQTLFIIKLSLALLAYYLGTSYWYFLCFFIVSNRVFTEGTCKLLNIVISDLVDEDFVKFQRKSPVSALIFGTSALLSKPGQTIAPLLGTYLLYLKTGKSIFISEGTTSETVSKLSYNIESTYSNNESFLTFQDGLFSLIVFIPITVALVQLFAWHFFTLHGQYLHKIKLNRQQFESGYSELNI
ncbi:transmembrane protein 180 [Hydra vulgaris]|nr:transmembrane protein 180 [Hydra vulgaris]